MTERELTPQERLLNALDLLTKPQHVGNWQKAHEHEWIKCHGWHGGNRCTRLDCAQLVCEFCDATKGDKHVNADEQVKTRTDPPLLDWLHDAIANSTGGTGGGKQGRERTPLDVAAFTLYEDIDGRVRSWMLDLEANVGKGLTPTQILRSWYVLWNQRNPGEGLVSAYAHILEGWVEQINDALDPPKRIEITAPCPVCGQEWINVGLKLEDGSDDPDDTERMRVLVAVERENMHISYAMCKACERVWLGTGQMRQLRIAIDDVEQAKGMTA